MDKTKILLIQIAGCMALGAVMGTAFWWFDVGRTCKKVSVALPNDKAIKVYQGRWSKGYLEVIGK